MSATTTGTKSTNGFKYSFEGDSLSQDLHLKMSKKIAQLTKVIYVLNTRNDDHENELEELANQQKSELRHTVAQMNGKIEDLENRIKSQNGDYNKILELQDILRQYEVLVDQTKTEFLNFKEDATRQSKSKDAAHLEQLTQLNDKISCLGESFKDLSDDYDKMQRKMENEKIKSLKDVEMRHEKEISELKEEFAIKEKHLRDLVSGSQKEIELELRKAQEEVKVVTFSREKTIVQYEDQIKELKKSHQIQLSESLEEAKALWEFKLEEAYAQLLEFQSRSADKEVTLHSLIEKHIKELQEKDSLIDDAENQTLLVKEDNKSKSMLISQYFKEIGSLKDSVIRLEGELKSGKQESDKFRKECENLNNEIQTKSRQMKELKSTVDTLQQKLTSRDHDLKEARLTIETLNQENKEMVHCTKSESVDYEIQIQTLKRGLEELSNERIAEKQALERLHLNQEIEQAELVNRLKNEHGIELEKSSKKLEKEWLGKEKAYKEEIQKLKDDLLARLEEERGKASKIIEKMKLEMEQIKTENASKLKAKDKQISSVEAIIVDKEKEIKAVLLQNKSVKDKLSTTKKEKHVLTDTVTERDAVIEKLTVEISQLQGSLGDQVAENEKIQKSIKIKMQEDMSERYSQLSTELDQKWADTLRRENGRLRNDLLDSFAKEKEKLAENAERIKNEEIACLRNEFQEIKAKLISEISQYKDLVTNLEGQLNHEKEDVTKYNAEKILQLEGRLAMEEKSHLEAISRINVNHAEQNQNLVKQFEQNRAQYMFEMEALLEATDREWKQKQESIVKQMTVENEKAMRRKMDEIRSEHNREISDQIREVKLHMSEVQQNTLDDYKIQIKDLNLKIQSLENQSKIQQESLRGEVDKVKAMKSSSDTNNMKLEQTLQQVQEDNVYLKKQIDDFNDDYHRNQKEFVDKLRQNENELRHHYETMMHTNKMTYEEDSKQTLQDFNRAQNIFKDKIKELSGKLLELEERYQNRPSRDQDVELMETLKAQLRTSEKEIERMNEEKKFFQLELMNRETNFNKIFNATPNVGKLDPTLSAIKTKKSSNDKMKNFPKLTPLPGSPFHDDPINPAKPLPPSRKSIDAS